MGKEVKWLSRSDLDRLVAGADTVRDRLFIRVLYETGCTVKELVHIRAGDVHQGRIVFSDRACRIGDDLFQVLRTVTVNRKPWEFLFSTRQSRQITTKRVRQLIQLYSSRVFGSKINPYALRYSHVFQALSDNVPLLAVQKQVGLAHVRASQLYRAFKRGAYES